MIYTLNPGNASVTSGKEMTAEDERVNGIVDATALDTVTDWALNDWSDTDTFFRIPRGFKTSDGFWFHFRLKPASGSQEFYFRYTSNAYTHARAAATSFGANTTTSSPSMSSLGTPMSANDFNDIDIHFDPSDAKLKVYVNGSFSYETGNGFQTGQELSYITINLGSTAFMAEMCFSHSDTRGWRVQSYKPTSIGALNQFAGSLSDIQTVELTEAAMSSDGAGSTIDLNFPNVQLSGMKVVGVGASAVADIVGSPESPVLEYSLFDGTDEHNIGYRYLTTESDVNFNEGLLSMAPSSDVEWNQTLVDSSSLRIRNVDCVFACTTTEISSIGFGFKRNEVTEIYGSKGFMGQTIDWIAVNTNGRVNFSTYNSYSGGETKLDITLAASNGPGFKFTGLSKTSVYSFTIENNENAKALAEFLKANPDEYLIVLDAVFY